MSAAFSPDGGLVVTGSWDQTARIWDAATGKALTRPFTHHNHVCSAAFHPDGASIVTASSDHTARIWSLQLAPGTLAEWRALVEHVSPFILCKGVLLPRVRAHVERPLQHPTTQQGLASRARTMHETLLPIPKTRSKTVVVSPPPFQQIRRNPSNSSVFAGASSRARGRSIGHDRAMYSASAAHYDRIYGSFKDYAAEARGLAELLRAGGRRIRTVLDVACGTGAHAALLAESHGFEVDGVDLDPALLAIAAAKCPRGRFVQADMTDLHLGRTFDAVLCLFGSIAYTATPAKLRAAFACLREHVVPGGVVVVEPFLTPDQFTAGHTNSITAESEGIRVTRRNRSERDGARCRLNFEYVIEGPHGTECEAEVHELGLFTIDQVLDGFASAGMTATYDPRGPAGRGLYVASIGA